MKVTLRLKGGSGSGNFGHEGRPGKVGGSLASDKGGPTHGAGPKAGAQNEQSIRRNSLRETANNMDLPAAERRAAKNELANMAPPASSFVVPERSYSRSTDVLVNMSDNEFNAVPSDVKNFVRHAQDNSWVLLKNPKQTDPAGSFILKRLSISQEPVLMKYRAGNVIPWTVTTRTWNDATNSASIVQQTFMSTDDALKFAKTHLKHV